MKCKTSAFSTLKSNHHDSVLVHARRNFFALDSRGNWEVENSPHPTSARHHDALCQSLCRCITYAIRHGVGVQEANPDRRLRHASEGRLDVPQCQLQPPFALSPNNLNHNTPSQPSGTAGSASDIIAPEEAGSQRPSLLSSMLIVGFLVCGGAA